MNLEQKFDSYFRIDMAGGWTDVPPLFNDKHGLVITASLNQGLSFSTSEADSFSVLINGSVIDFEKTPQDDFLKKAVEAVSNRLGSWPGIQLSISNPLTVEGGLGGSGVLVAGLVQIHHQLNSKSPSALEVAELARSIEVEDMGHPGGWQDPVAAMMGGVMGQKFEVTGNQFIYIPQAEIYVSSILNRSLVIGVSNEERVSGRLIQKVQAKYLTGDAATKNAVNGIKEAARKMIHALMNQEDEGVYQCVRENEKYQYELLPEIHHPGYEELKTCLGTFLEAGKPLGAGGGGVYWAIFDNPATAAVAAKKLPPYMNCFVPTLASFRATQ